MSTPNGGATGDYRAPSMTGLILVDEARKPVHYNCEAIAILSYPRHVRKLERGAGFLPLEIQELLLRPWTSQGAHCTTAFTSGRRRYRCSVFALNHSSGTRCGIMTALLLERDMRKTVNVSEAAEQFHLTQREQETIGLLTLGLTSKEIATRMNISPNTVKTFFRLVMTKMGVSTRSGIVGKIARM